MGVCTLFTIFFEFLLRSSRYNKNFLPVLSKLSQARTLKIFYFLDEQKVVSVAPQRGVYQPPINPEVLFSDIFAQASRLNTLYGLETLYLHLDTLESLKNFRGFSDVFDVFMTSSMSDFYVIFHCLDTASGIRCAETLDFHIDNVF